jgi:hypothetical protein
VLGAVDTDEAHDLILEFFVIAVLCAVEMVAMEGRLEPRVGGLPTGADTTLCALLEMGFFCTAAPFPALDTRRLLSGKLIVLAAAGLTAVMYFCIKFR